MHSDDSAPTAMWLVPHTHWDREWYEPHDVFRARLIPVIDRLLDLLEDDGEYRFTLDGQTAMIDDYLAIRPENTERLCAAVARGQLAVGPFAILMDEFCCDGETMVRNLEQGIHTAQAVGGVMRVGYLPDMFGHAAQMPQLLKGFGMVDAALWRGVPAAVDTDAFRWRALDGSEVRVEYLWDGYGSALKLFEPEKELDRLVAEYLRVHSARFRGSPPMAMFGTDHMTPRADLLGLVRGHNARCPDARLTLATLGEVVASRPHDAAHLRELPVVVGELRAHVRGNILPGVLSVRTELKAAMARAERDLTTAERLDAATGGPSLRMLCERGWRLVVESSAHDSATGCGCDDTAAEVLNRLRVASHTARGAIDTALSQLAGRTPAGAAAAFNQSGWERVLHGETVLDVEADAIPEGAQLIEALPTVIGDERIHAVDMPRLLRRIHGRELFGRTICGYHFPREDELVLETSRHDTGAFDPDAFSQELHCRLEGADPDATWHVVTRTSPSCRVLLAGRAAGMSVALLGDGDVEHPVRASERSMTNGLIRVDIDDDGLVRVTDLPSGSAIDRALAIVDEGDRGDSYNYGPVPSGTVRQPVSTEVLVEEHGPLRGRIRIHRVYRIPVGLGADGRSRSPQACDQGIDTRLELRQGERFVRVRTSLVNAAGNHRLRIHVPIRRRAVEGAAAAGQYGVTWRGRAGEGGWGEYPLPTYPAARFVHAGGVAVLTDRTMEYEILTFADEEGAASGRPDEIALTLLRAVGLMSVNLHPLRDEPAGAEVAVPDAQYLGTVVTTDFAIDLSCPDWDDSDLIRHADQFRFDPVCLVGTDKLATAASIASPLSTHGRVALESLRRLDDGVLEARFVNYHRHPEPLRVRAAGEWDRTDLTGTVTQEAVSLWDLDVPAAAILTLRRRSGGPSEDVQSHGCTDAAQQETES
ncbi:glycoside hydrolase family 38 C-terminal domain-containing protein [Actinomyces ruminicola]|uniref:Alpha-mannosidase n=1 Tax=Actinomyces ruminicola TaxID=332524 RepID=A0A1G9UL14_9ACTO|nr:glycoside hydrolase family 38 C-terminal domain-containing protein [Actinomyces ruminicola]SDM60245.1 alpha-mannosidase [Actinomyces ruminicola]